MSDNLPAVTDAYCREIWENVCNWGRWGDDDQRGALNLITPDIRRAAAALVVEGVAVGIGNRWPVDPAPDNMWPAEHRIIRGGDDPDYPGIPGLSVAMDYIGVACHGIATSHVDALCHVFVEHKMYNGYPATDVRSTGALRNDMMPMADGVVTRGVLLDMPRTLGVPYLAGDVRLGPAELEAAARAQGVEPQAGDVLIVHLGRERRLQQEGAFDPAASGLAGLHPECARWLHGRDIAMLGSDGMNDPQPNWDATNWVIPMHYLCICGMGLTLLHNLSTEPLARACEQRNRWAFLLTIAPLKVPGATGSPVNPVVMF